MNRTEKGTTGARTSVSRGGEEKAQQNKKAKARLLLCRVRWRKQALLILIPVLLQPYPILFLSCAPKSHRNRDRSLGDEQSVWRPARTRDLLCHVPALDCRSERG
jgi:hypothetical protein